MVSNIKTMRERTASTSAAPVNQEQGPEEVVSFNSYLLWLVVDDLWHWLFGIPADDKRQRQGREEEEGRNGSTQEREDHGSDVRDAETLH